MNALNTRQNRFGTILIRFGTVFLGLRAYWGHRQESTPARSPKVAATAASTARSESVELVIPVPFALGRASDPRRRRDRRRLGVVRRGLPRRRGRAANRRGHATRAEVVAVRLAEAARHYDERALAGPLLTIAAINVWNRLNTAVGQLVEEWNP